MAESKPRSDSKPKPESKSKVDEESQSETSFEDALNRLDEIVRQLEEGGLPLADALARYEEGTRRLRECYAALKKAERKIELLVGVDEAGTPQTRPFADDEESLEEKQRSRASKRSHGTSRSVPDDLGNARQRGIDTSPGLF